MQLRRWKLPNNPVPSVRNLVLGSALVFGSIAILVIAVLLGIASLQQEAVERMVYHARGQAVASELGLSLLSYQRLSNLYVLTGEQRLGHARRELPPVMLQQVARARALAGSPRERALLDRVEERLDAYLRERLLLEARNLDPKDVMRQSQATLGTTLAEVERLREMNGRQVADAAAEALRLSRVSRLAGVTAALTLVLAALLLALGGRRHLLRPLLALHGAIVRFRAGDANARTRVEGLREISELAGSFNDMAESMARQRELQLTFLAGVAHDLRDPLSALKLGLHTLGLEQSETSRRLTCARLERHITRLARMVEDLLDAIRIERGDLELRVELFDLRDVVEDMVRLYGPTSPGHQIRAVMPGRPVPVRADPVRMGQIVSNLITNAMKYSPTGGPVTVTVTDEESHAVLAVSDQGIGIRPEDLQDIGVPFHRVAPEVAAGAGLGLSVVRRIVTAHGGTMEVESEPGAGSTFRIRIPRLPELSPPHVTRPRPDTNP